jgi:hypothetical protein
MRRGGDGGVAEGSCGEAPATAAAGYLLTHATRLSAVGDFEQAYGGLERVPFKAGRRPIERSVLKLGEYLLGEGNLAKRGAIATVLTPEFLRQFQITCATDLPRCSVGSPRTRPTGRRRWRCRHARRRI